MFFSPSLRAILFLPVGILFLLLIQTASLLPKLRFEIMLRPKQFGTENIKAAAILFLEYSSLSLPWGSILAVPRPLNGSFTSSLSFNGYTFSFSAMPSPLISAEPLPLKPWLATLIIRFLAY